MSKAKKFKRIISNIIFWTLILIICIALAMFLVSSRFKADNEVSFFGYRWYNVLTASMSPEIAPGDMIVVKVGNDNIKNGDAITFNPTEDKSVFLTHRVVSSQTLNGEKIYTTKGDNNTTNDASKVTSDQIIGKCVFTVPKLGTVVDFVKSHWIVVSAAVVGMLSTIFIIKILFRRKHSLNQNA